MFEQDPWFSPSALDPLIDVLTVDGMRVVRGFLYGFPDDCQASTDRQRRVMHICSFDLREQTCGERFYAYVRTCLDKHSVAWTYKGRDSHLQFYVLFGLDQGHGVNQPQFDEAFRKRLQNAGVLPDPRYYHQSRVSSTEWLPKVYCCADDDRLAKFVDFLGLAANHSHDNMARLACALCRDRAAGVEPLADLWPFALDFLHHVRTVAWTPIVRSRVAETLGRANRAQFYPPFRCRWWNKYLVLLAHVYDPTGAMPTKRQLMLQDVNERLFQDPDFQRGYRDRLL